MKHIIELFSNDTLNDYREDYEIPMKKTIPEYFELTGAIYISKEQEYAGVHEFHFGPAIKGGYISDTVYLDSYLQDICSKLDIEIELQLAENLHGIPADSKEKFNSLLTRIIEQVNSDGYKVDFHTE